MVQLVGLCILFWFPVGTLMGIPLMVWGTRLTYKYHCGACGNRVGDKHVRVCPVCHARLGTG
jgi:rubrerythrin